MNVKTNLGAKFLKLIDKHFPTGSPLHALINRRKVKISYRCLPNVKSRIAKHNSKLLKSTTPNTEAAPENCNCQEPSECPLDNQNCRAKNVIYQATVKSEDGKTEKYVGLTAPPFKTRWGNHKSDFKYQSRKGTTLSAYIWKLKGANTKYEIEWKILGRAAPYSPTTGVCNLCLSEKHFHIFKPETNTLNKRNKLFATCRLNHRD